MIGSESGARNRAPGLSPHGSAIWAFGYDAENRLLTACKPVASGVCSAPTVNVTYAYDPLGRRTKKNGTGVSTTWFLNDGDDEIAEYDSTKTLVTRIIPGPAIDEPAALSLANGSGGWKHEFFHTNHQGSVVAMSNDDGSLAEGPFLYDPYGDCFKGSTACAALAGSEPYKFTGRRLDPETGLYYYRARYYWSDGGRFLQTDPVGYTADLNLYTYVGNDPVDRTDPSGLFEGELYPDPTTMTPEEREAYQNGLEMGGAIGAVGLGVMLGGPRALALAPKLAQAIAARAQQRALQSLFKNGPPKASDLVKFGEKQGWTKSQTEGGPLKLMDKNGVPRMTIKEGSPRTPGSENPHVEIRDETGQRINPSGEPVSRRSPENHTPIEHDLQNQGQNQSQTGVCSPNKGGCGPGQGWDVIP